MTTGEETYLPRLNHVAFTMDRALLDDAGRAEILDFYGEVFGWTEGDNSMTARATWTVANATARATWTAACAMETAMAAIACPMARAATAIA